MSFATSALIFYVLLKIYFRSWITFHGKVYQKIFFAQHAPCPIMTTEKKCVITRSHKGIAIQLIYPKMIRRTICSLPSQMIIVVLTRWLRIYLYIILDVTKYLYFLKSVAMPSRLMQAIKIVAFSLPNWGRNLLPGVNYWWIRKTFIKKFKFQ